MFLLKFLLILLIFYYLGKFLMGALIKGALDRQREMAARMRSMSGEEAPPVSSTIVVGEMVACSACGTYVARRQGIERSGRFFCGQACSG